jgi:hypothetical protein
LHERGAPEARLVFDAQKGEFFNETVFVTSDSAELRMRSGEIAAVHGIALMSDGAAETLYNRAARRFAPAVGTMLDWLGEHSERKVRGALARNLEKTMRDRTGDDLAVALMRVVD